MIGQASYLASRWELQRATESKRFSKTEHKKKKGLLQIRFYELFSQIIKPERGVIGHTPAKLVVCWTEEWVDWETHLQLAFEVGAVLLD